MGNFVQVHNFGEVLFVKMTNEKRNGRATVGGVRKNVTKITFYSVEKYAILK
jgi:hypothetical protein